MRSLVAKTLYDKRWFMLGWSLALCAMVLLVLSFFPAFSGGNVFEDLSKNIPAQFKGLVGDSDQFKNISNYIAQQLFDTRIALLLMIMAIILGLGLSVNEEEKGTLRSLLVTPLSRVRVVLEKWLATVIIMGAVALAPVVGIYLGLALINETADGGVIWQLGLLSWLFGSTAVAISLGLGLATGSRGFAMSVSITVTIGSFILSTFGKSVEWLEPFERYSLMHYYSASKVVEGGIPVADLVVLGAVFLAMLILACLGLRRRDVL